MVGSHSLPSSLARTVILTSPTHTSHSCLYRHVQIIWLWGIPWVYALVSAAMADHVDSPVKELVPIVIGTAIWGRLWHRGHVCFYTDNMAVVVILCKKSAQDPLAHQLLRRFFFIFMVHCCNSTTLSSMYQGF